MKIFFVASIHGKDEFEQHYRQIVKVFEEIGHKIVADHVLGVTKRQLAEWDDIKDIEFHKKVLEGVKRADIVAAELSYSSTSVGYLLSVALEAGKPTIAFYTGSEEPHLLQTLSTDEKFQAIHYGTFADLKKEIPLALEYASEQQDTRFNFFIAPKHQHYLDWVSRKKMVPRAVHLRRLLERDMEGNKEYQEELAGSSKQDSAKPVKPSSKQK